jgi:hypothetical protein
VDGQVTWFEDVSRAVLVMNRRERVINPHTGKYNVYAFGRFTAIKAMQEIFLPHQG